VHIGRASGRSSKRTWAASFFRRLGPPFRTRRSTARTFPPFCTGGADRLCQVPPSGLGTWGQFAEVVDRFARAGRSFTANRSPVEGAADSNGTNHTATSRRCGRRRRNQLPSPTLVGGCVLSTGLPLARTATCMSPTWIARARGPMTWCVSTERRGLPGRVYPGRQRRALVPGRPALSGCPRTVHAHAVRPRRACVGRLRLAAVAAWLVQIQPTIFRNR
jgi:hypothetical protein